MATKNEIWIEVCNIMIANPDVFCGTAIAPPGHFGPWSSNDYANEIKDEIDLTPPPQGQILLDTVLGKMQTKIDEINTGKGIEVPTLVKEIAEVIK